MAYHELKPPDPHRVKGARGHGALIPVMAYQRYVRKEMYKKRIEMQGTPQ